MSVIQKIRDKYARIAVVAIAISLLGFILMDAFAGRTGMFGDAPSKTIGKVNGVAIDRVAFENKIKTREAQYRELNDETRMQVMQGVWDEEVSNIILTEEFEKLGLTITDKEQNDLLYGANPPQFLAQAFTDDSGRFDANTARMRVNEILKTGSVLQKSQVSQEIENAKKQRLLGKYMAMLANSMYMPKWFFEKHNVDNSLIGKISYINIPYSSIPDSAVKVSDDEIRAYMEKHEKLYEQKEETRSISYVTFSAAPSAADSAAARDTLISQKAAFDSTKEMQRFLEINQSTFPFYDGYISKNQMQQPNKDSILSVPVGGIYGPYVDANPTTNTRLYVMSKILGVKQYPDTVNARHILIATHQRTETGSLMRVKDDSTAKKLIDSIQGLLNKGEKFDSLVVKLSEDPGSKDKGGVYENIVANGQMVPEFNAFIFERKVGDRDVVKTDFGYHIIEVLSQRGSSPAYKIAYYTKPIEVSLETDQAARNQANLFAGDSRDLKSFNENYDKKLKVKGINKMPAADIRAMDNSIPGLPPERQFIKKIFEEDEGDVIGPERVGENYVVAVITEVIEPGLKSVNSVRTQIEPRLRDKKKGAMIVKNIGKITTLEDAAAKQKAIIDVADSIRFGGNSKVGFEPKLMGAIFNPANKGKVVPEAIIGNAGVFVVRVESTSTTPVETADIEQMRKDYEARMKQSLMSQLRQGINPIVETLKRGAKIKDNRPEFY